MRAYKEYFFTINNFEYGDIESLQFAYDIGLIEDGVVAHEGRALGKTPHLQMVIRFEVPQEWKYVKSLFPRAHIEVVKNFYAAYHYCTKEGRYVTLTNQKRFLVQDSPCNFMDFFYPDSIN